MIGFIIEADDGTFLAQGLWWYNHDKLEDCFVFNPEILNVIAEPLPGIDRLGNINKETWVDPRPRWAYPASYTQEEGVVIIGERFPAIEYWLHSQKDEE